MKESVYFRIILGVICFIIVYIFVTLVNAQDISLKWDANTESDLAGYKLYYRTVGVSYNDPTPVEDVVPIYGSSPIVLIINCDLNDNDCVDNADPLFILEMDLSDKDYWIVLTAYDNEEPENESGYSNEVNTIDTPSPSLNNNGSSSSDSGSGGCFINTLKEVNNE